MSAHRAQSETLDGLHALMAEAQAEELRRNLHRARKPKTITEEVDGKMVTKPNPDYEPLSPKLLAVIRAFLKDNGIDAPAASPRFNNLINELKNLSVDELGAA